MLMPEFNMHTFPQAASFYYMFIYLREQAPYLLQRCNSCILLVEYDHSMSTMQKEVPATALWGGQGAGLVSHVETEDDLPCCK